MGKGARKQAAQRKARKRPLPDLPKNGKNAHVPSAAELSQKYKLKDDVAQLEYELQKAKDEAILPPVPPKRHTYKQEMYKLDEVSPDESWISVTCETCAFVVITKMNSAQQVIGGMSEFCELPFGTFPQGQELYAEWIQRLEDFWREYPHLAPQAWLAKRDETALANMRQDDDHPSAPNVGLWQQQPGTWRTGYKDPALHSNGDDDWDESQGPRAFAGDPEVVQGSLEPDMWQQD